jgi:retron-type reverse transcriptase
MEAKVKVAKTSATNSSPQDKWSLLKWQPIEREVTNMRMRIYQASRNNNESQLRELQKLFLRSKYNLLHSIRRKTILNQGRKTPGLDHVTTLSPTERWQIFTKLERENCSTWNGIPTRRVYIPKANEKL